MYRFALPDGVPISLKQEKTQLALVLFPCLHIVTVEEGAPTKATGALPHRKRALRFPFSFARHSMPVFPHRLTLLPTPPPRSRAAVGSVDPVTVSVRRRLGQEYWTKVPEDYALAALIADAAQFFQVTGDGGWLVDRRTGERVNSDAGAVLSAQFGDLVSQPQAVILLQLEGDKDETTTTVVADADADAANGVAAATDQAESTSASAAATAAAGGDMIENATGGANPATADVAVSGASSDTNGASSSTVAGDGQAGDRSGGDPSGATVPSAGNAGTTDGAQASDNRTVDAAATAGSADAGGGDAGKNANGDDSNGAPAAEPSMGQYEGKCVQ